MLKFKKSEPREEKKNWYTDRYQTVLTQRNLLAIGTLVALVFSFVAIFLVYRQIPIVTVEPFVIQVEPKSGITQVVKGQTMEEITANEAVNKYFIAQYLHARETVGGDFQRNYQIVRLMSEPNTVFREYAWLVNPSNPDGYVARLGAQSDRQVKIQSITSLTPGKNCLNQICQAQVRITVDEKVDLNGARKQYHLMVFMEYTYTTLDLTVEERYMNPLGFRVVTYRVNEEVIS